VTLRSRAAGLGITALVLALLPLLLPNAFWYDLATRAAINAVVVIGLNLLIGYAGQISLGHAGFIGIGAYASAILPSRLGVPPLAAMVAGALATALLALLVARPMLRLRGHALAMATLGLGIILSMVFTNESQWTGGPDGIVVQPLSVLGIAISGERQWYWLAAAVLLVTLWASGNLVDSPFGRAMRALRTAEPAARAVGVDVARIKASIFVLSAVGASLMGSVTAHYVGFVTPQVAGFLTSVELLTMVVVGGMASLTGSVVGAAMLTVLPQLLTRFEGAETAAFGLILAVTMIVMPRGLVPTVRERFGW
jgi:branched-chain amino acid transport system permease protein